MLKAPYARPQEPQELPSGYSSVASITSYGMGESLAEMTLTKLIRFCEHPPLDGGVAGGE